MDTKSLPAESPCGLRSDERAFLRIAENKALRKDLLALLQELGLLSSFLQAESGTTSPI